jgi:peptide/nickel transport system permease protein
VLRRFVVLIIAGSSLAYLAAALALDPRAALEGQTPRPPRAVISARLTALGLDEPLFQRYLTWAADLTRGDFGQSLDGTPIRDELLRRTRTSLCLAAAGGAAGWIGGLLLGTVAAARPRGPADRLITAGALLTMSTPAFALAVLAQTAAQAMNTWTGTRLLEWTGEYTPGTAWPAADRLRHLLLPVSVIALSQAALLARYQRGLMRETLKAGHVRAAMARGLHRSRAIRRHALRVTLAPMTTFAAYGFATLLTGTAITEKTFAWHGLGEWLIDSITNNDVNTVAACGCATTVTIATVGLATDLAHGALDPRTRS